MSEIKKARRRRFRPAPADVPRFRFDSVCPPYPAEEEAALFAKVDAIMQELPRRYIGGDDKYDKDVAYINDFQLELGRRVLTFAFKAGFRGTDSIEALNLVEEYTPTMAVVIPLLTWHVSYSDLPAAEKQRVVSVLTVYWDQIYTGKFWTEAEMAAAREAKKPTPAKEAKEADDLGDFDDLPF